MAQLYTVVTTVVAMKETEVKSVDVAVISISVSVGVPTVAAVAVDITASVVSKVSSSSEPTT